VKAILRTNLYTKKQNIQRFVKSPKERDCWKLEGCPPMPGFAGICRENSTEFLTKKFSGCPTHLFRPAPERQFLIILFLIFSFIVRNCAGFFVNLGKQNGATSQLPP